MAWNNYNLYRNIDESNTAIPSPDEVAPLEVSPEDIENFSEEQREEYKIKQDLGIALTDETPLSSAVRPSVEEI
jgi:hypothetical protein